MSGQEAITLQNAVDSLYEIAVVQGKSTSTIRLQSLAQYCVQELERRNLQAPAAEVTISGGGRPKQWDVAWKLHGKYRLAISLKSILKNVGGTVPNRIDDLIGEVANVQMYSPEVVVGYVMVFDMSQDSYSAKHGITWSGLLSQRLKELSGRRAPSWSVGMIEAFAMVRVDFSSGPKLLTPDTDLGSMLDKLVSEVVERNPALQGEG